MPPCDWQRLCQVLLPCLLLRLLLLALGTILTITQTINYFGIHEDPTYINQYTPSMALNTTGRFPFLMVP